MMGMRLFDAELERVSTDGEQETRTLVLHVTDRSCLHVPAALCRA